MAWSVTPTCMRALGLLAILVNSAEVLEACSSTIPTSQRRDCYPGPGSTQQGCIARGCVWCEAWNSPGTPFCFYDDAAGTPGTGSSGNTGGCPTSIPEAQRVDCHPESGSTADKCAAKGCVWCPAQVQGRPWCFYDSTAPSAETPPASNPSTDGCSSTIPESQRKDCYSGAGSSEAGCKSRGCLWCPARTQGNPWCFYADGNSDNSGSQPSQPSTDGCSAGYKDIDKIDCLPSHSGSTPASEACVQNGCFWCPSQTAGTPWCFFNTSGWPPAGASSNRVNCLPEGGGSSSKCQERGCLVGQPQGGSPLCYFPEDYGYSVIKRTDSPSSIRVEIEKIGTGALFGNIMTKVAVIFEFQRESRLRVKFEDMLASKPRFEVPLRIPVEAEDSNAPASLLYDVVIEESPVFVFKVIRKSTGVILFDTSLGGLTLEDQFLQIATRLPSSTVYGLGETEHHSFKHDMNWQTWGMYARDQPPAFKGNLYGVHPFYTVLEDDGNSHGVLFLNSAAQDVTLTPAPGLVYRTIGGILDIYMFLGPTPENVVQQYTGAIGRPVMPAYWSLGFQLCRYGYNSIGAMKGAVDRMRQYSLPHDVQYGDIDTMSENLDFTYDTVKFAGFPDYIRQLKREGTRFISILDPCIDTKKANYEPLTSGNTMDVWVKEADGITPVQGKVWPPNTIYFPDYTKPSTRTWWIDQCKKMRGTLEFDGLWIDMNEPANFVQGGLSGCTKNNLNNPPFTPAIFDKSLISKTICPDYKHHLGSHYDVHNLYGWSQSEPTLAAVHAATGKRGIVISRSTFTGSGKYAGHWLGDNYSQWSNLYYSIIGLLEFNLFGIPYIGADICGFNGNTNPEQCQRWMQLGAFYTFSRNHNGIGYSEQDPGSFGAAFAASSKAALEVRYTLLPYLYTLFYHAHVEGSTVIRPVVHEYPTDETAKSVDRQFLWGSALLITPVLTESATSVSAYFPDSRWFSYYTGKEEVRAQQATLNAPIDFIPVHTRGGYILPTQEPANATMHSRKNPFGLMVMVDDSGSAQGDLFWDDGETIDSIENGQFSLFTFKLATVSGVCKLTATSTKANGPAMPNMDKIKVYGLKTAVGAVSINGAASTNFQFDRTLKTLNARVNTALPRIGETKELLSWTTGADIFG